MDVIEAIRTRRSIRSFKPDPVDRGIIAELLEASVRAPSAMNCQPWEFTVLTGEPLERIKQATQERLQSGQPGQADRPTGAYWPKQSVYRERQVDLAKRLFSLLGIERDDHEARQRWLELGFRFFDAPVVVVISVDSCLDSEGPLMDIGALVQNFCLAALDYGLGTCIQDQGVAYPDLLREQAGIGESKRLIISVALGYPDLDDPVNRLVAPRQSAESLTSWLGFGHDG